MSKNKLQKFSDNKQFPNVWQPNREAVMQSCEYKGKWAKDWFQNDLPIVLELGCGKGEYTIAMAEKYPDTNYIGMDIKGARFWTGAKYAIDNQLKQVAFIRSQIELIDKLFDANEIAEIWITFPDPQKKFRRTKHRLTNPTFLAKYKHILQPNGKVHLKTDSEFLHGYTLGVLAGMGIEPTHAQHNIYLENNPQYLPPIVTQVQTFYEKMFLEEGKEITYLQFSFPS